MQMSLGNLLKDHKPLSVVQMLILYVRCISSKSGKWISNFPQRKFTEYISAFRALSSEHKPNARNKGRGFFAVPQNKGSEGIKDCTGLYYTNIFFKCTIYKSNELEKTKDKLRESPLAFLGPEFPR